ncbi:hypothetical protein TrRE_jg390 [Triparma retinervis]|uniref:Cilia- and flagella-associated protein 91 n=1 Tax=Triparma retinervis TaxID=2557542 RepID=A0A9W6ZI57_9STRA|nr:hypothetical protein TrRE_jg390 [Triparma retinervis]
MSYTRTVEQRAYDHLYDPVYTTPATGLYRESNPAVKAAAQPGNDVSGTARHKYFKQPIVPHLHAVAPEVLLAPTAKENPLVPSMENDEPLTKAVGVQTKYRDSEAQTAPYTPQFVVNESVEEPEVMMLDNLTSLPVGLKEVTMIERAREKRALDAALPPITDEASLDLRKRLMEQQELREFQLREEEFDAMREKRLEVLRKAIDERDASNEFLAEQRVEALRQRMMEDRDKAINHIQQKRIKALRKLSKARKDVPIVGGFNSHKSRDIIGEYSDYSSAVYAPIRRAGHATDKGGEKYDVLSKTAPLSNLDTLAAMENTIPAKLLKTKIVKPNKSGTVIKTAADRKNLALASDLELMERTIVEGMGKAAESVSSKAKALAATFTANRPSPKKRLERPPTPTIPEIDENAESEGMAILLFQRLLRGRAVQNTMFEGKERRIELIKELRASEGIVEELDAALRPTTVERKTAVREAALDTVAGETSSALFDFLAKDLVRKEEKDKLQAMAEKAEMERKKREIVEGGKRQAEELLRDREDEAFRQVTRVHHSTAVSFVQGLMEQALEKVVQDVVMKMLKGGDGASAIRDVKGEAVEQMAKELVGSFLEPSAAAIAEMAKATETDARITAAATETVDQIMTDVTKNSTM